jgi:hypothetical protein
MSALTLTGSNENTGSSVNTSEDTNLSRHSPEDLEAVANTLNARPRKTLQWRTPVNVGRILTPYRRLKKDCALNGVFGLTRRA